MGVPVDGPAEGAVDVGGAVEVGGAGEAGALGVALTEPVGDAVAEIAGDWLGEGAPYDT
ncbi:hypothetical protein [Microbispora sp. CA-102843]|uniref:hypothetical protein n=1 Tax=Microbispora sp. CA-102843 TaxID=3239952 RepID=UPI003D94687B